MFKSFTLLLCALFYEVSYAQNVGINATGAAPNSAAGLDVDFSNKGILVPRVGLTGTDDTTTVASPIASLLVYNTATAGTSPNDVSPGYYYYTGAAWTRVANGNASVTGWGTSGNSGTTAGTNFLGTTDAVALSFKTNNTERLRVLSDGKVGMGTTTPLSPLHVAAPSGNLLYVQGTAGGINNTANIAFKTHTGVGDPSAQISAIDDGNYSSHLAISTKVPGADANALSERMRINSAGNIDITNNLGIGTAGIDQCRLYIDGGTISNDLDSDLGSVIFVEASRNQFLEMNIQNTSAGLDASADIVATNDSGTDSTGYIDMGINSSGYRSNTGSGRILNGPHKAYLYSTGRELYIGNATDKMPIIFFTNNSGYETTEDARGTERMRLNATGELQLGFTSDQGAYKLQVNGDVLIDDLWYDQATQTSDRRLKTNISSLNYGLNEVLKLKPVTYNWKKTPDINKQVGLIAQEVRQVIPEIVKGDESKENIGMDYIALVPVLINAIKEQQKQIDELKQQVQKLQK